MINDIKLATKAEIQKEMELLEEEYQRKEKNLKEKLEETRTFVQETDKEMRSLSEQYNTLKKEIDKREGKG